MSETLSEAQVNALRYLASRTNGRAYPLEFYQSPAWGDGKWRTGNLDYDLIDAEYQSNGLVEYWFITDAGRRALADYEAQEPTMLDTMLNRDDLARAMHDERTLDVTNFDITAELKARIAELEAQNEAIEKRLAYRGKLLRHARAYIINYPAPRNEHDDQERNIIELVNNIDVALEGREEEQNDYDTQN